MPDSIQVAVIGAGNVGIAVAYYLLMHHGIRRVTLVEAGDPMAMTSAQSGENYRNWWPHPVMTSFTEHAITLLEDIARGSSNRIGMTRRGYVLATRRPDPSGLLEQLHRGYGEAAAERIRVHRDGAEAYHPAVRADWQSAPVGVDVLLGRTCLLPVSTDGTVEP